MTGTLSSLLPGGLRDSEGPVFREPWEAQAFAMAVKLNEAGHFTWVEWADYLSDQIKAEGEGADGGADYYRLWLQALERLVADKDLLEGTAMDERKQYLADNPVPHVHVAKREPVCVA